MPFLAAFEIRDFAEFSKSAVLSVPASFAALTFLTAVFMDVLVDLFLSRLASLCFARFIDDLWLANFDLLLKILI